MTGWVASPLQSRRGGGEESNPAYTLILLNWSPLTSILSRTEGEEVAAYVVRFDEKICTVVASGSSAVALAKADVLSRFQNENLVL